MLDISSLTTTNLGDGNKAQDVELLLGPYRSGKTTHVVERTIDFCQAHPFMNSIAVVPSWRYQKFFESKIKDALINRAAEKQYAGIVGLQIKSFHDLCQTILRRLGINYRVVPEPVRTTLLARAVAKMRGRGELHHLAPAIHFPGTCRALLALIDELQRTALSPEEILTRLEFSAHRDSHIVELANIYHSYCLELSSLGIVDQRQLAFKLWQVLASKNDLNLQLGSLTIDGFDRFSRLQLCIFAELAKHAKQCLVTFDIQKENGSVASSYSWKESSFRDLIDILGRQCQIREFSFAQNRQLKPVKIETFKATDRFLEMAEIARRVKSLILTDRIDPDQILVVSRDLHSYRQPAKAAFAEAGLDYLLDDTVFLKSLPVVQQILRLISLAAKNFAFSTVMDCLRSPYINLSAVGIRSRQIDFLERLALELRIVEGRTQWGEISLKEQQAKPTTDKLLAFFAHLQPPALATVSLFVQWLEDLLDKFFVFNFSTEHADPVARWLEQKAVSEFRKILGALLNEEIILGNELISSELFLEKLDALIKDSNFPSLQHRDKAVTICGADFAPSRSYQYVFVAGLIESEFPRRPFHTAFTGPDEVARWATFGIDISNPRHHAQYESALLDNLIGRAKNAVCLSYACADFAGEELFPSFVLSQLNKNAIEEVSPFTEALSRPTSNRNFLSGLLWNPGDSTTFDLSAELEALPVEFKSQLVPYCEPIAGSITKAKHRLTQHLSNWNGYLSDSIRDQKLAVALPVQWSTTKLSDYGKCPFRFWISHMLHCEPITEPSKKPDVSIIGKAYHKAMELFYRRMSDEKLRLVESDLEHCRSLFAASVEDALTWLDNLTTFRRSEFWHYEKLEIKFRLERFFEKEVERARKDSEGFFPVLLEAGFGSFDQTDAFPPLIIEDDGNRIAVAGRVDRIDRSSSTDQQTVRIIDYKSGSSAISRDDAYSGRNLQLPLYILAVERSILPGSKVTKAQYLSVNSGEVTGSIDLKSDRSQNEDSNPDIRELAARHVHSFVSSITSGDFTVKPSKRSDCSKCRHQTICRISEID